MSPLPKTMKAWVVVRAGQPRDALELRADWPSPAPPGGGDIVVKVSHAALNPLDLVMMRIPRPFGGSSIPVADFVGEVVLAGSSLTASSPPSTIRVGMTVCGMIPTAQILRGAGTLAEYVVVPAHMVAEKPPGLGDGAAAGLIGVAGQSSAVLLRTAALAEGDRALVKGASGGVGCVLLQALRASGIRVTAICSGRNEAMVRRLGADEVIDYTAQESLYAHLGARYGGAPFDAVIDLIGDATLYKKSPGYLKPEGRFLTIAGGLLSGIRFNLVPALLGGTPRKYVNCMNSPSGAAAKEVAGWFEKGWVKEILVDSEFDMDSAMEGFEKLASKRAAGKIIVKVHV